MTYAVPHHSNWPTRPSSAQAPISTPSLTRMTLSRRGSQNSSATIARLDHSAPTQVAPIRKASAAVATATASPPAGSASARMNGVLSRNCSTGKFSAVLTGPHCNSSSLTCSSDRPGGRSERVGRFGSDRHCSRNRFCSTTISATLRSAAASCSGVVLPNSVAEEIPITSR